MLTTVLANVNPGANPFKDELVEAPPGNADAVCPQVVRVTVVDQGVRHGCGVQALLEIRSPSARTDAALKVAHKGAEGLPMMRPESSMIVRQHERTRAQSELWLQDPMLEQHGSAVQVRRWSELCLHFPAIVHPSLRSIAQASDQSRLLTTCLQDMDGELHLRARSCPHIDLRRRGTQLLGKAIQKDQGRPPSITLRVLLPQGSLGLGLST